MNNIDKFVEESINLLKKMIQIPSFSRNEDEVCSYIESYLHSLNLKVNRAKNNLYIVDEYFDNQLPTILLNSHIDTVKPSSGWKVNPFEAIFESGKIIGLGANDAGASVVSQLAAFRVLNQIKDRNYNIVWSATAEEECSGLNGIEYLFPKLPEISLVIIGEPTNMNVAIAEKGLMVLDCQAKGLSGHAARGEGINAIYNALNDIDIIRNIQFEKSSSLLGDVKMSVTQINAGFLHNVVPDICNFVVDVRSNEMYSNQEIIQFLESKIASDIIPRSTRLNSSKLEDNHPFMKKCSELGFSLFGSPTLSDQALLKCDSVKIGPGDSARSHTSNEFIYIDEIYDGVNKYFQILKDIEL